MKKMRKIISLAAILCVLGAVTAVTVNAKAEETDKIAEGVYIGSVNVGGMTAEEAAGAISAYVAEAREAVLTLAADDRKVTATAAEFGISYTDENLVQQAMDVCKSGSLIKRYKDKKDLEQGPKVIPFSMSVDTDVVSALLEAHVEELNIEAVDSSLTRENGEFSIVEGNTGVVVNVPESVTAIETFLNESWDGSEAEIALVAEIEEPRGTVEELSKVKDLLGGYSTNYSDSAWGRCTNISVATGKINGTVLYPGDEFSVGQAMAPLDKSGGYELAGAYENGQTVQSYGGGVCQVSSTLFNAVILAELEVTERSNHSMIVSYVQPSMDAAIAGDYKDLKFKNNLDAPIYIEGYTVGKNVYFNIYGQETRAANREVKYISEVIAREDPVTQFVGTGDPVGYVSQVQSKHVGYVARLWKVVTEDGVEVSREIYNKSTYKSSPKIVNIGTASADPNVTAVVNAALATGDEATIYAAIAPYAVNASTVVAPAQPTTPVSPEEAAITGTVDESQITEGTDNSGDAANGQ